jgi:hypothetical protein
MVENYTCSCKGIVHNPGCYLAVPISCPSCAALRAEVEKANYKGPGSPIHSLTFLISELHERFPDAHNPILSDPPEPKYLAAIDSLLAENRRLREKIIEVSSQNLIIDGLPLDKWIYDAICRNRGGLGTLLK